MGYRSNVKILMGLKGFERLKTTCESSELDYVRKMTLEPDSLSIDEEAGTVLIGWTWSKWYPSYEDVAAVERVLSELRELVEQEPTKYPLKDYFYKKIEIGEDCAVTEDTNDWDDEYVSDFYVVCDFSL